MHGTKAVVAVEHAQIVIGVVKDFLDVWIREQRTDRRKVGDGQGIDQRGLGWARDLHEVNAIAVAVETCGFGIYADAFRPAQLGNQVGERRRRGDIAGPPRPPGRPRHSSFPSASMPAAISSRALARVL